MASNSSNDWSDENFDSPLHQSEILITEDTHDLKKNHDAMVEIMYDLQKNDARIVELRPSATTEFRTNLMITVDQVIDKLLQDERLISWQREHLAAMQHSFQECLQQERQMQPQVQPQVVATLPPTQDKRIIIIKQSQGLTFCGIFLMGIFCGYQWAIKRS